MCAEELNFPSDQRVSINVWTYIKMKKTVGCSVPTARMCRWKEVCALHCTVHILHYNVVFHARHKGSRRGPCPSGASGRRVGVCFSFGCISLDPPKTWGRVIVYY